jgi:hypothetical protein
MPASKHHRRAQQHRLPVPSQLTNLVVHVQVVHGVLSGVRLSRPSRCPRELYSLMLACWAAQPEQRPSFNDILATFRSEMDRVFMTEFANIVVTRVP